MPYQTVFRLLSLAVFAYAAYALLLFLMQRQILYPGRHIRVSGPPPAGIVPIPVVTATGRSDAWFMPPLKRRPGERRPLVIFFHGNGEVIDYLPEQAEGFRELGMGVLLVEYPGFGRSAGTPTEKSITETAVAAYDAVLQREEVDPRRIVLFGRSLGGGAACALAARRPSAALILQSTFSSTRAMARSLPGSRLSGQGCLRQRRSPGRIPAAGPALPRQQRHHHPAGTQPHVAAPGTRRPAGRIPLWPQ